jgi:hypothetical protein
MHEVKLSSKSATPRTIGSASNVIARSLPQTHFHPSASRLSEDCRDSIVPSLRQPPTTVMGSELYILLFAKLSSHERFDPVAVFALTAPLPYRRQIA